MGERGRNERLAGAPGRSTNGKVLAGALSGLVSEQEGKAASSEVIEQFSDAVAALLEAGLRKPGE